MEASYVLDYDVYSVSREQNLYLLARIEGSAPEADDSIQKRPPLNLSLVLDRSGSMAGDKLDYVKKAAQFLVQHLSGDDLISLVTYDNEVRIEVPTQPAKYKDRFVQAIQKIQAGGSTNLSGGWLKGCQLIDDNKQGGQVNRALLLTDGLANQGVTDPVRLERMAAQKRSEGITTTTMGVGMRFNEDLLTRMAAEGGGAFYFIDNPDQAPHIFSEELTDLLNVIGQNLTITLILSPNVAMIRQMSNYPVRAGTDQAEFLLGDLYAEEEKTLLVELSIPAMRELGEIEVARLRFEYDELAGDTAEHRSLDLPIVINLVPETRLKERNVNPEVSKSVLMLRAARTREEAVKHADKGDFRAASIALTEIADDIAESGLDDTMLQAEHDMLREEAMDMELGAERYTAYTRKSTISKSSYTTRYERMHGESVATHNRMKSSRPAIERGGDTPQFIAWKKSVREINMDVLTIGRAEDSDIMIDEENVSRHHCQIIRDGDDLYLEDLQSMNGTFANGGQIQGRFRLSVGDVVTVGSWLFMLRGQVVTDDGTGLLDNSKTQDMT